MRLIIISLLFNAHFCLGQTRIDSIPGDSFDKYVHALKQLADAKHEAKQMLLNLNQQYCSLKHENKSSDNIRFIKYLLANYQSLSSETFSFVISNYGCFDDSEIDLIESTLNASMKIDDPGFHQLASIFQIHRFRPSIEARIAPDILEKITDKFVRGERIKRHELVQLSHIAVLANLGDKEREEELIRFVKTLFSKLQDEATRKQRLTFFNRILSRSLRLLYSENAILQTLEILDYEFIEPDTHKDVIPNNYAYDYYFTCIALKMKNPPPFIFKSNFDAKKQEIKDLVLSGKNSIWKRYIRVNE